MNPFHRTRRHRACPAARPPLAAPPPRRTQNRRPPPPCPAHPTQRHGLLVALIALAAVLASGAVDAKPFDPVAAGSTQMTLLVHEGDQRAPGPDDDAETNSPAAEHADHADHAGHAGHAGHGPIGVMGDHAHEPGEVMVSYRYMHMDMDGNRDGDDHTSVSDIFARGYMVAPTRMSMDMHMLGAMVGVTDRVTAMLMVPWLDVEMDHRTRSGGKFRTRSSGVGDITLSGILAVWETETHNLLVSTGLAFPTGSINERDDTPMGNQRLPYPMQIGSGTWDLIPGLTYSGSKEAWGWGLQFAATVRTGRNSNHYRLGDRYRTTGWAAWQPMGLEWLSTSLRLGSEVWENIDGRDPLLNPAVVPTADPNRRGGHRVDLGFGVSLLGLSGLLADHRLGLEVTRPVYQDLDGPQLETDWMITLGWEKAWY